MSHSISLVQICLRGCYGDLGIYIYFGFPFSVYISVLCIPGHLPLITTVLMIFVISVWVYICYVLAGITAALEPAFKPKCHNCVIIYCETSDHFLVSMRDGQLCRPKQIHKDLIQRIDSHDGLKNKILLTHYFKATRAFAEKEDWVGQDVCLDVFLRALPFKYMSESSKNKTYNNFFYVVWKRVACEPQTYFRSSLPSIRKIKSANMSDKTIFRDVKPSVFNWWNVNFTNEVYCDVECWLLFESTAS